jgi:hypothetical protein
MEASQGCGFGGVDVLFAPLSVQERRISYARVEVVLSTNFSSVSWVATLWTGRSGFDSVRAKRLFLSPPALGPTRLPIKWIPHILGVKSTIYLHTVLKVIMCGTIPPLLMSSLHSAWLSAGTSLPLIECIQLCLSMDKRNLLIVISSQFPWYTHNSSYSDSGVRYKFAHCKQVM